MENEMDRKDFISKTLAGIQLDKELANEKFYLEVSQEGMIIQADQSVKTFIKEYVGKEDLKGKLVFDLVEDKDLEGFVGKFRNAFLGASTKGVLTHKNIASSLFYNFIPVFNDSNKIEKLKLCMCLHPPKLFMEEIDNQLRGVLDNASIGIYLTRPTGEILDANQAGVDIFGYSLEELQSSGRKGLFEETNGSLSQLLKQRAEQGVVQGELIGVRKDGSRFPAQVFSSIYKNSRGEELTSTIIIDISQQRNQELKLRETTEIFEALFHNHPDAVYSFNLEGNFISVNRSAIELAETSEEKLLDSHFIGLIPEEDRERVMENFTRAAAGEVVNYDTGFISTKSSRRVLNVTNFPLVTNSHITGVFGIARDITELEVSLKQTKWSQDRFRNILDQSLDLICTINKEGRFLEVSRASVMILGYTPEELIGRKYIDLVHPDDVESTHKISSFIRKGNEEKGFTNRYVKKDGKIVQLIWSVKWSEEEEQSYCVAKDVTHLRETEQQILQERNLLRAIIDNIPDYIFVINRAHEIILGNKSFYSGYLGKAAEEEVLKLAPKDYFISSEAEEIVKDNFKVMASGKAVINRKDIIKDHQGNEEVIMLTKVPLKTDESEVNGLVGIGRKITQSYLLEKEQKLVYNILNSLGKASSLKSGLEKTLRLLSEFLGFDMAEAWQVGYDSSRINKIVTYGTLLDENKLGDIDYLEYGEGLPGLCWKHQSLEIWTNLQNEPRFKRKDSLEENRNILGVAVPIVFKEEVIAVLCFFGLKKPGTQKKLSSILMRIALQIGVDIKRKITEQELLKYQNIIESSRNAIGLIHLDSEHIFLNKSFQEALGYEEKELKGLESVMEVYSPNENIEEVYTRILDGNYWEGDLQLKNRKGGLLEYHLSAGPVYNDNGELIAIFGVHNDISERKAHEVEVRRYNQRIHNILNSITDGFYSLSKDWEVTYWNKAAEDIYGVSHMEMEGVNFWNFFPEAKQMLFYSEFKKALRTGEKVFFEEYYEPLNEWFEVNAYPGPEGLSVYFKIITDRKRIDEEIRIAKERYDLVSKATREAVYDWNITESTLQWSNAYYEIFGYKKIPEEKNLDQWKDSVHPDDLPQVLENLFATVEDLDVKEWDYEYRMLTADKNTVFVYERGYIIRDGKGKALRMIGAIQDVTRLKNNERVLEKLNKDLKVRADELMMVNKELEQFAYIASHDLQEPLRMVTSFLSQLQKKYEGQLDEKAQKYIHFAFDGATRMRQIILDLLEYSRAGRNEIKLESVDLNEVMENIIILLSHKIELRAASIEYEALPTIVAAKTPLQQVISNIIVNAIKYRDPSRNPLVKIDVKETDEDWIFSIKDNGIGIESDFFEKIFIVFQRLHRNDEYSGTGIGLAICKKIIERHGGKLWLESEKGVGSTFYFNIPKQF